LKSVNGPFLNGFASNLIWILKIRFCSMLYHRHSYTKILSMATAAILKFRFRSVMVAIACLCNEFDTEAESRALGPDLLSKFTSAKNPRYAAWPPPC